MTDHDKHLEEMRLLSSKLSSSEEKSREFFKSAGIHDEHGDLAEQYKAVDGWVTYHKYPTKTFMEWVQHPSKIEHDKQMEHYWDMSNFYDKMAEYERAKIEKERQIRKNYINRLYGSTH